MRILALDIATRCGWAANCNGEIEVGTWELATKKEIAQWGTVRLTQRRDPRIRRLINRIEPFCGKIDCIVWENVEFMSGRIQCQLWASLRTAVWLACKDCDIWYDYVSVKTLKLFATGDGAADKSKMIFHAAQQRPDLDFDSDSADAFHVLQWALHNIKI